jgi:ABC-type branched-subunit amino acid transport system substrate-binding protein
LTSNRRTIVAISTAIAVLALAGCKGNSPSSPSAGPTNPGITKTTVTVGTVSDLTGFIPGLFQGASYGVDAYFAYVNSQGGINGRTLKDDARDDAESCATNAAEARSLTTKTFALVGSFSIYDSCSAPVMLAAPTVPYVAVALDPKLNALPNEFSPEPVQPGYRVGPLKYIKQKYGVSKVGFLAAAGAPQVSEQYEADALKSIGATVAYSRFYTGTEVDFTSDVLRMKRAGVNWVFLNAGSAAAAAHIIQNMYQQNFHPKVIEAATAYDNKFFGYLSKPSIANGVLVDLSYERFLGEDAATSAAVKLFDTWIHKTHPTWKPDLYTMYGWSSAELFANALKAAGPNPTRAAVLAALKTVTTFDAGGLLAPANPAGKLSSTCWILTRITNQKFERLNPAGSGYACTPGGYYAASH